MDGGGRRSLRGYTSPVVTDYGTLAEMTADGGVLLAQAGLENGLVMAQAASIPLVGTEVADGGAAGAGGGPGTAGAGLDELGGQEVLGADGSGGSDALPGPGDNGAGAGEPGRGGSAGVGGDSGGAGGLPFTGFLPATIAAVGGAFSAAGLAVRRRLRG